MLDGVRHNDRLRRAWVWVILPLLVYVAAAVIVTWPLARHLVTHAAGAGYSDTYEAARMAWEAKEQLLAGENPLHHERIAYPQGVTSRVIWSTPLRWVPVMVLGLVFPPITAFNLWLIAVLALNGLAAYWLGMALTRGHIPAALLGGLVFAAFPTMQGHLSVGHIGVLSVYGLPLFALCWWRALFDDAATAVPWRTVIGGGIAFALAALGMTSQIIYLLMPLVVFSGLYALLVRRQHVMPDGRAWYAWPLARAAAMVALGGMILVIFFGPLLAPAGRAEVEHLEETGRVTYSADLLAFVSPSPFGALDDLGLVPAYARDVLGTNSAEGTGYLGLVAVALAAVAVLTRKAARPWLVVALGAMLLSLGPLLKVRDTPLTLQFENYRSYITLPWAAVQDLPVINETRTPGRFNMLTGLACAALVSLGAQDVLRRVARRNVALGVALLLGAIMLLEYQLFWPYLTIDATQPDYFKQLAARDDVDAVYNVPALDRLAQKDAMGQQMVHKKPMIAGQLNRRSPQDPAVIAVLDRAVLSDQGVADALPPVPPDVIPALLRQAGADRLILHKRFVLDPARTVERLREVLGTPEYQDDRYAVFVVPEARGASGGGPLIAGGREGWSQPVSLDGLFTFFGDGADWYFYTREPLSGELLIPARGYAMSRKVVVRLDGDLLTGVWADPSGGDLRVPLWVEQGFHTLQFDAVEDCTLYPFTLACLGGGECAPVEPPLCISAAFGAPEFVPSRVPSTPLEVTLAHGVRLRGYMVEVLDEPRAVHVRLFWEADHALPESYALFVHVADPTSAAPFAQYADYPLVQTDDWDGGAAWVSDVTIPLDAAVPAGDYALNVGWFAPETGARLGVESSRPWAADGIVHLEVLTLAE